MKTSLKVLTSGAMVAAGLMLGSGTAHAHNNDPTASLCAEIAQSAINEGHTFAFELDEWGVSNCPAVTTPPPPAHDHSHDGDSHDGIDNHGPAVVDNHGPAPVDSHTATTAAAYVDNHTATDDHGSMVHGASVEAIAVLTATVTPAAVPAVAVPAAAAPVVAARAPAAPVVVPAASAKSLPVTGGDIAGLAAIAAAGIGIGGLFLLVDKRRRAIAA
jgi:LPXTG-motif cell wall-anchored protein